MDITTWEQLFSHIKSSVSDAMQKEVAETTKDVMIDTIQTIVYDAYTSKAKEPYLRQYANGGLIDKNNISTKMVDETTLEVRNTRRDGDRDVASIVEVGEGYTWENSEIYAKQPFPRPFHEETVEKLKDNKEHLKAMVKGLKRNGIVAEYK